MCLHDTPLEKNAPKWSNVWTSWVALCNKCSFFHPHYLLDYADHQYTPDIYIIISKTLLWAFILLIKLIRQTQLYCPNCYLELYHTNWALPCINLNFSEKWFHKVKVKLWNGPFIDFMLKYMINAFLTEFMIIVITTKRALTCQ